MDDSRAFLANNTAGVGEGKRLRYDRVCKGYLLEDADSDRFTNSEILAVCKILLESRSLVKEEMMPIIDKLLRWIAVMVYVSILTEIFVVFTRIVQ